MYKKHSLLTQLIQSDSKLNFFTNTTGIINQGLAPLISELNPSPELQKAKLLEQAKSQNWFLKAKELCDLLIHHNIDFIIFKGFAYHFSLYQQLPLRPHSDIDVFVDVKDYKTVEQLLLQLNYKAVSSRQGKYISFQNSFYDDNKINTVFDVHWQISNRTEIHDYFKFDKIYQSSTTIKTQGLSFQTLDSLHAFIYACFHYQAHRQEDRKHIWLYDIALLWVALSQEDKNNALNLAINYEIYDLVGNALQELQSIFGQLVKFNSLPNKPFSPHNSYLKPRKNKLIDFWQRLKNIKGISNKIIYVSEYLFQNKNYVQARYKLKTTKWVYLFYPKMWLEDIIKLIKKT